MKTNLLLTKAHHSIHRQLVAGFTFAVIGLMLFNVGKMAFAGNTGTTTTNLCVTAGALEIYNAPATMDFASATSGTETNVNALEDGLVIRDFSTPGRWNLYANASQMNDGSTNNIPATGIKVWPSTATKVNVDAWSNLTAIGNGTDASALDSNVKIFNSSYNTSGAVGFNTLKFNATVAGTLPIGVYTGTLKFTVIAD